VKVLVTGGRDYDDHRTVKAVLDYVNKASRIISLCHGGATGADSWAGMWSWENDLMPKSYDADWKAHGKAAGPIRNSFMLKDFGPDLCVMFPGSNGTADMVSKCRRAGVPVFTVEDFKNGNKVPVPSER
jgi:hypothetical protein